MGEEVVGVRVVGARQEEVVVGGETLVEGVMEGV